ITINQFQFPGVRTIENTCSTGNPNGMAFFRDPPTGNPLIEWTYNNQTYYNIDTLRGIAGGQVHVSIIDENNCSIPQGTYEVLNRGLTADAEVLQQPTCDGNPGSVRITISGGTPAYTINHNGDTYQTSTGHEIPFYRANESFNIKDSNPMGCSLNLPITSMITGGETFTLNDSSVTHINCETATVGGNGRLGQFDGNISTSSNTTPANFTSAVLYYADSTPVHGTRIMVNPATGSIRARYLEAGNYFWRIEGECPGAFATFEFTIRDLIADLISNPPTINAVITPIGCGSSN